MSVNKVILVGNLGQDPKTQHFESGAVKTAFSLATTETYTGKDGNRVQETEWHNIVIWGKLAEIAEKYLQKGKQIYVEGKIKTRSWDDKDGNKRYTTEIEVSNFQMLGGVGGSNTNTSSAPPSTNTTTSAPDTSELDDLPF